MTDNLEVAPTPGQLRDQLEQEAALARFGGSRPTGGRSRYGIPKPKKVALKWWQDPAQLPRGKALENKIKLHLLTLDIPEERIDLFLGLTPETEAYVRKSIRTLTKIVMYGLPTPEEYTEFSKMPKNLDTLRKIKHPLLYDFTVPVLVEALAPYIGKHTARFYTERCDHDDCEANGMIGVLNALQNDAGIQPFAQHAYLHTKTKVRRQSAQAGVIRRAEKRPSKTEIRRVLTYWMRGNFSDLEEPGLLNKYVKAGLLNKVNYLDSSCLEKADIQKIDYFMKNKGHAQEELIRMTLNLDRFDKGVISDLVKFLLIKFHYIAGQLDAFRYDEFLNKEQFKTIGDIVNYVAIPPDFHGNPVSFTTADEDGNNIESNTEDKVITSIDNKTVYISSNDVAEEYQERTDRECSKEMVRKLIDKTQFSPNQKMVRDKLFGLDGQDPITGSALAKEWGKFIGEAPGPDGKYRSVSRQRIAQNQAAITKKFLDSLWNEFEGDPHFYKLVKMARRIITLSEEDEEILINSFGLDGNRILEVDEIAALRWTHIGNPQMSATQKKQHIQSRLHDIKLQILKTII